MTTDSSQRKVANIWSTYIKQAASSDRAMLESWKGDMDSVIIFVRLSQSTTIETSERVAASRMVYYLALAVVSNVCSPAPIKLRSLADR